MLPAIGVVAGAWLFWAAPERGDVTLGEYPSEYQWVKRTWPHFTFDPATIREAAADAQAMRQRARAKGANRVWENVGPYNISGRISDLAFDPLYPDTIWAGAATGGVLKSVDGGDTWSFVFDAMPTLQIGDIAVDPMRTQTVYVGTGEANGGHNNFPGMGVYKTDDGGDTWRPVGLELTTSIGRIIVDPQNTDRVWVAAIGSYFDTDPNRGVYRTLDGGETWDQVLFVNDSTGVIDLVMDPRDSNVLYAAAWQRVRRVVTGAQLSGAGSAIYKSTDGGDSWTKLTEGLPTGDDLGRIGLAICAADPDILYALYSRRFRHLGLYYTDDGGQQWVQTDPYGDLSGGTSDFAWYFGNIRVDPSDCQHVFVLDVRFWHSWDRGETWGIEYGMHVDHHALEFHPQDSLDILVGNDGGLGRSKGYPYDFGPIPGIPNIQFYEIGLDPSNPERFYGGTQDNGTLRNGGPDGWYSFHGGDGFYVIVDPGDPNAVPADPYIVYAESQWGALVKYVDWVRQGATNGIDGSEDTNWATPVVMDPNNSDVLYYGAVRLYRTTNGAQLWEPVSDYLVRGGSELAGTITTIAVSPVDSNIVWVGTDDGYVWVTDDYGANWSRVSEGLPVRWVSRVVADPVDTNRAYITYNGLRWRDPVSYVYRTHDLGGTWDDISSNLPESPVNAFAVDPLSPQTLYLGNDVGAFVSYDGGAFWESLGEGMPAVTVSDLKIFSDEDHHFLVAGTYGRSMYKLDLARVTARQESLPVSPPDFALHAAYPNPFDAEIQLAYEVTYPAHVTVEVLDVLGRRVAVVVDRAQPAGQHTISWTPGDLVPGTYFVRLLAGGVAQSVRPITRR